MDPKQFFNFFKGYKFKYSPLSLGLLLGTYTLYKSLFKVEPGFRAIKFNSIKGVGTTTYSEGFHLLIPYLERPIIYDCRMKNYVYTCVCGTKDLQTITLKTRLILRPNRLKLPELYRLLGRDYEERALLSIVYEICGVAVSQYNAAQINSQRDNISYFIKQRIQEKAKELFLDIDDCALIDILFSAQFSEAIEKKQVAQQEAERMKFFVEQALEDKKSTIIKTIGETEAVKKFGEANQYSNAFLMLRRLETAKHMSKLVKNSSNRIMLDTNAFFLNLPMTMELKKK